MARFLVLLSCSIAVLASSAQGAVVEHTFHVSNVTVNRLCQDRVITAVNGRLPGPKIRARDGDTVVVHVLNESPYNITIHWHGIFQLLTAWMDGPNYITQCPIVPGRNYTYWFNVTGQEGTLWWHAHVESLRATVHGALVIKPRSGSQGYPFPKPHREVPILLGEWWNANVVDVDREAYAAGVPPNISDAFTINGKPGDLYPCSQNQTYRLRVARGKTYLLRIINAALNAQLFFKVAGHRLTVVGADACYTTPYTADVVVIAPGQTLDSLMVADASPGRYYMAASAYVSAGGVPQPFDNTTATAVLQYDSAPEQATSAPPVMPIMPAFHDTVTATGFYAGLTSLIRPGHRSMVPLTVDERMFVTIGLNLVPCGAGQPMCKGIAAAASMNNISFAFPTATSLLEAHFKGAVKGVYTADFPDRPALAFNFTNPSVNAGPVLSPLLFTAKGTRVKRVKYNATVEVVLQNTAILGTESHPMHLHGHNFFVVAQGSGNYNPATAAEGFNLVNPQERNTLATPPGGWAVIRFTANNPGMWIMHCHLDAHLRLGLAMAFEVGDGPDPSSTLSAPPSDYPAC